MIIFDWLIPFIHFIFHNTHIRLTNIYLYISNTNRLSFMKNLYIISFLLVFQWIEVVAQKANIEPELFAAFEKSPSVEYIVFMKDRVKFNNTLPYLSKQEKASYVYQLLVDKANHTQSAILHYVSNKKLPFQLRKCSI